MIPHSHCLPPPVDRQAQETIILPSISVFDCQGIPCKSYSFNSFHKLWGIWCIKNQSLQAYNSLNQESCSRTMLIQFVKLEFSWIAPVYFWTEGGLFKGSSDEIWKALMRSREGKHFSLWQHSKAPILHLITIKHFLVGEKFCGPKSSGKLPIKVLKILHIAYQHPMVLHFLFSVWPKCFPTFVDWRILFSFQKKLKNNQEVLD